MEIKIITESEFSEELKNNNIKIDDIPKLLVEKLTERGMKIASAESCTGGLISKLITDCSGASQVFDCGVCSYANEIKEKILGVSHETLKTHGAVSAQCSAQMAEGVRKLASADIGISTTGIAGPLGGTPQKPVGTVYISCATATKAATVLAKFDSQNNPRDKNRQLAAALALYCALLSF